MNESSSLLKRSFEGLGFCQADYEDAATAVVWLESHGLCGFDTLRAAWPRLSRGSEAALSMSHDDAEATVVDGDGASLLVVGRALVGFAGSDATPSVTRIECLNVYDRIAILPSLMECAAIEIATICYWQDGLDLHMAMAEPGHACPDYHVVTVESDIGLRDDAIYIACCNDTQKVRDLYAELPGSSKSDDDAIHNARPTMTACWHNSVLNGLRIDQTLLQTLSASAERVLVESTDQSRRGAGEHDT